MRSDETGENFKKTLILRYLHFLPTDELLGHLLPPQGVKPVLAGTADRAPSAYLLAIRRVPSTKRNLPGTVLIISPPQAAAAPLLHNQQEICPNERVVDSKDDPEA